ncbi:hypothetical protein HCN51_27290 [Nonomuraea sp. FMUSA5-5]|uniref:DUF2269 domain-containing protein n=1 Tax=Nonomuraea composti TaxID=2720023 RepID=A0ABX1BBI6_9ACTN|nr:hypothetical protein [Nonomuraea sp. FMUSA5-5]NJP93109.1 hypothetical protein [Nonomuraea sp. FMUSA5-5]
MTHQTSERGVRGAPPASRRRLSRGWRRATLVVHVISAGAWIGIDVIMAVLVLAGWFAADVNARSLAYRALAEFVIWPMLGSALVCLVTGVVLGAGTTWGLVRYWWVAVKLALNLALCILIVVLLMPGMDAVGSYGERLLTGTPSSTVVERLFFPPAVSLSSLSFATILAVWKPWGRLRLRTARREDR